MNEMNHEELELQNFSKLFEFEKISRELDSCSDVDVLRNTCKCYVKLYMKMEEVICNLGLVELNN
jgi:hypothetical protein